MDFDALTTHDAPGRPVVNNRGGAELPGDGRYPSLTGIVP